MLGTRGRTRAVVVRDGDAQSLWRMGDHHGFGERKAFCARCCGAEVWRKRWGASSVGCDNGRSLPPTCPDCPRRLGCLPGHAWAVAGEASAAIHAGRLRLAVVGGDITGKLCLWSGGRACLDWRGANRDRNER